MAGEDEDTGALAHSMAEQLVALVNAVVALGSGKAPAERREMNDTERFVANTMLMIAVHRFANAFHLDPAQVHLAALSAFWKDVYTDKEIPPLEAKLGDEFNKLFAEHEDFFEDIGDTLWDFAQTHDRKLLEDLGETYRFWIAEDVR